MNIGETTTTKTGERSRNVDMRRAKDREYYWKNRDRILPAMRERQRKKRALEAKRPRGIWTSYGHGALEVGQSIYAVSRFEDPKNFRNSIYTFGRKHGRKFSVRAVVGDTFQITRLS